MKSHRVTAAELAPKWGVQARRVVDILRNAGVRRTTDRTYDAAAANVVRAQQIARDPVRTLIQGRANQHGPFDHKLDGMLSRQNIVDQAATNVVSKARTITPDDYDSDPLGESDAANNLAAMDSIITAGKMAALRAQEVQARIDQRLLKNERERGQLIGRSEVARQGERAGRQIMAILSALPAEVAAMFPYPEGRPEIRKTVQGRIDQALFAVNKAVAALVDEAQ